MREVHSVRERERERCRERDGSDVTIVALKLAMNLHVPAFAKNSHNWRWVYTFPCQKLALFASPFTLPVSPFTERSPLWRWNSQWVHTFHCQKFFRPLCSPSFKWLEPRDEWSKTQDKWSNPASPWAKSEKVTVWSHEREQRFDTSNLFFNLWKTVMAWSYWA